MKRLLIHIGYPKTATTTIQESLFVKLHEAGIINYFGKSDYSPNNYFKYADCLLNSLNLNQDFNVNDLKFSSNKLNVISIEEFTVPIYSREIRTGRQIVDPFEYSKRLVFLFNEAVDNIKIMATVRNQKDLIYSYYVQVYDLFVNNEYNDTPTKFIFEDGNTLRKERLKNYYFPDLLEKYEDSFGEENIYILLFEDLKYDPSFFYDQLSQILNIESSIIENLLEKSHLNQRKKTQTGYYRKVQKATAFRKVLDRLREIDLVDRSLDKIVNSYKERYGSYNKILNSIRKLMYKEDPFFIPKLSEQEQNIIFKEFRESNLKLSEKYNIDQEKLKKYGYI
jgi:ribosomal protein L17